MHSEYTLPNCTIQITGVMNDGRTFRINTQGDGVIRTKKKPWETGEFSFDMRERLDFSDEYELVADLSHDFDKDAVFTMQIEKTTVTRSVSAPWHKNVDVNALRKRLGVPTKHTLKFLKNKTRAVFEWEEEV